MKKILLCGIQKSGSTWGRFVVFNYFNILKNNAKRTLNFDELKAIHLRRGWYPNTPDPNTPRKPEALKDGFPLVYHTHLGYDGTGFIKTFPKVHEWFEKFDGLIYIYRNPFDTMISYYEFLRTRDETPYMNTQKEVKMDEKLESLENFTKYYLPKWISHVKSTKHRADVVLDYDELRENPSGFIDAIELIDESVDLGVLEKAIKMSDFNNIKKMSIETKQPWGVGGPLYKGLFCRDGRTGQYKERMSKELIKYIKKECKNEGIKI
jgi:hypothetical protein